MKITITENINVDEPEISIVCRKLDRTLEEIISLLRLNDHILTGKQNDETFFIPLTDIIYFETVDRHLFFYTASGAFETQSTLSSVEGVLSNTRFARISKQMIVDLRRVKSIKRQANSRLCATLENGERLIVSRQYIGDIMEKLGVS